MKKAYPVVAAIIPAKAVSKRIPEKNLKLLAGKPMLAYILAAARKARGIDRIIVSTESEEIKKVALNYGAEVPFMRPKRLTKDGVTTHAVIVHALNQLKKSEGYEPDYVLILYPTSPLLPHTRIEEAIRLARKRDADSVISGQYDKGHYWIETNNGWKRLYPKQLANSQFQKPLFAENGAIYLTKTKVIRRGLVAQNSEVLPMGESESIDVDYPEDFERVAAILKGRRN